MTPGTALRAEPAPPAGHLQHYWQSLHGSASSLMAARLAETAGHLVVYVAADTGAAFHAQAELRFYAPPKVPVLTFPDWETLPYDHFSAHQDITSERLATLYELPNATTGALVVPVSTLLQRLAPPTFVQSQSLVLRVGARFDLALERERLTCAGYRATDTVSERGEFAVRGSLLDIFPMGAANPIRIDLFDDEIDSLRTFDADNQRTISQTEAVRILPARETPLDTARDLPVPRRLASNLRCRCAELPDLPGCQRRLGTAGHRVLPAVVLRNHGHPVRLPAGGHGFRPGVRRPHCGQEPPGRRCQPLRIPPSRCGAPDPAADCAVPYRHRPRCAAGAIRARATRPRSRA